MNLASQLRSLRNKKGITLLELSETSNVSVGYICDLEKGNSENPSLETLTKLSKALNVRVSDLLLEKCADSATQ